MKHFDIKLDDNNELLIVDGDFLISECTIQHIKRYLNSFSGEFRRFPSIGANLLIYRGELNNNYTLITGIDTQLRKLGYDVIDTTIENNRLKIFLDNGFTITV